MYTEYRLYTVEKFCQLWRAGITANFHVETHAMALTLTSIISAIFKILKRKYISIMSHDINVNDIYIFVFISLLLSGAAEEC